MECMSTIRLAVHAGLHWAAGEFHGLTERIPSMRLVNVPSGRGIGDIGIIIPIGLRFHKGAGNAFCHALSSSAWRFWTRILAPT